MAIRTILFDLGGTIVFPNWRRISDEFAADGVRVAPDALEQAEARVRRTLDTPEVIRATDDRQRWLRYMAGIAREAGMTHVPEAAFRRLKAYHDRENLWEIVAPEVPSILTRLAATYRLGAVSNANGTVRAKLDRLDLARHFEIVIDSHEVGVEKPDPAIFRIALDHMKIRADETAYVGDLYHVDVLGAAAAGLRPILIDPLAIHAGKACRRIVDLAELLRGAVDSPDPGRV